MAVKADVKIEGVDRMLGRVKHMRKFPEETRKCIKKSLAEMRNRNINDPNLTPKDTGELRNSGYTRIMMDKNKNCDVGVFGFSAEYAPHVEYGHRIVVKGVDVGYVKGVHFLKRNADIQRPIFRRDCEELTKEFVRRVGK